MQDQIDNAILVSHLDAINEAQKRARLALFFSTLAAGTILAALWNSYLSWDIQWAYLEETPEGWGRKILIDHQIRSWIESNTVGVSLLGIRLSVSDAAVLGATGLLVFSFYYCMCMRRENHEIGALLLDVDAKNKSLAVREFVFLRIRSFMVFNTLTENDAPYSSLSVPEPAKRRIRFSRFGFALLNYLPVATVALIILSDVYYLFWYASPWRRTPPPILDTLNPTYRWWVFGMVAVAAGCGYLIYRFCRYAGDYHRGTSDITKEFFIKLKEMKERPDGETQGEEISRPIQDVPPPAENK